MPSATSTQSQHCALPEPPPRYLLPGGKIGVSRRHDYLRTLAHLLVWLGAPPLLARLLGRLGARGALNHLQQWWARRVRHALNIQLDIDGLEHIDRRETYIITPLHEGFVDVLALLHLPLALRFVVRDEFLGWWLLLGPYLHDTGQVMICPEYGLRSYRQIRQAAPPILAGGESLVIFPQGSILGIEIDCMPGAFALARALHHPILPVAITGTHRVWEYPYTPRLRYGQRVSLRVLAPVSVADMRHCKAEDLRHDIQQRLKRAALSGTMASPRRFVPARDGYWDGYAYRIDPHFAELADDIARHREENGECRRENAE
jgi:1-acyl-sn-glycerol-3-phosphate acyltransferase